MQEADFIIVGAGSAGCVLANRLSAQAGVSVALIEAGGECRHPIIDMPLTWMQASADNRFIWGHESEADPHMGGGTQPIPRGKALGGSSSINGTMYIRGHADDYDSWRDMGLPGWGFADVLPYFRRSERNWRGESSDHGGSGELHVTAMKQDPVLFPAFMETARGLGYHAEPDFNQPRPEGFGIPDCTIKAGRRHSTVRAFIDPVRNRSNLHIETDALVTRVLIEEGRATGVEYQRGGQTRRIMARREVILCGGAINSPQLLMLSGVGPADHLGEMGIAPLVNLPGVGANLQDHPVALSFWEAAGPVTFDDALRLDRLALHVARWALTGTGNMAQSPMSVQGFLRSGEEQARPDLQFQIVHASFAARPWFPGWREAAGHQFSAGTLLLNPQSRGTIALRSSDPVELPRVHLNFLSAPDDVRRLLWAMHFMRRFFASAPANRLVKVELAPGPDANTDAALEGWLRATTRSGGHLSSTCAMGVGAHAVLDANLRVRGVDCLRVIDASSMPQLIRGNTNAPVIMMAEKGADLILGRTPPSAMLDQSVGVKRA